MNSAKTRRANLDRETLQLITQAKGCVKVGDLAAADLFYDQAFAAAGQNLDALTVVASGFADIGKRDKAIDVLQTALQSSEPNETILTLIGQLAQHMDMHEIAVKVFQSATSMNPSSSAHYVNLANSYRHLERYEEGIELIQSVLPMMPEAATLWNVLATLLQEGRRDYENAETFYREALRLDPQNDQILLNMANFVCHTEEGKSLYEQAIAVNKNNHEAHIGLAIYLLHQGDLKNGWKHYEHRRYLDTGYSTAVTATNKLRLWKGDSLNGKKLLVMPEQGIGDEILFARCFPALLADCKQLIIGCDPRLEDIYKRSFPGAIIAPYCDSRREGRRYRSFPSIEDEHGNIEIANCAVWAGSLPKFYWHSVEDIPTFENGYLTPDPELVERYKQEIRARGPGPYVGLSWRSENVSFGRQDGYIGMRGAHLLLRWLGNRSSTYCLQYGWLEEEAVKLQHETERALFVFDDTDLKNDIEANLAIMSNLDLVVGPPIATQQFALASGVRTKIIAGGAPWWCFGETDTPTLTYAPNCSFYKPVINNFVAPIETVVNEFKADFPDAKLRHPPWKNP